MESALAKMHERINRSTIVRRDRITGLQHDGGGVWSLTLVAGEPARIGRSNLAETRRALAP